MSDKPTDLDDGFEIAESASFATEASAIFGSIEVWDDVRFSLDLLLRRDPNRLPQSAPVGAGRRIVRIARAPAVLLLYEVDLESRVVTYLSLRVLDPPTRLDPQFDIH